MAGPQNSSSLPAKKPKPKAVKPAKSTYSALSAEFVVDSDDSVDAHTPRVQRPVSKKTETKSSSAKPTAIKASVPSAKLSKKRKSPTSSPGEDSSSGSESENDGTSQDENSNSKKRILPAQDGSPTPKPKMATARPVLKKPSINVKPLDQKNERGTDATQNRSKFEVKESSGDDSSGSESGSESESASGSSDQTSLQSPRKKTPVQRSGSQQPTSTYKPPTGFESTSILLHPASALSEILAPSNLQGKQIWHITVPESVPISSVKEVSTQNIGNGASILDYRGAKYGLVPESEGEQANSRALLLPSAQTNDYRPSTTKIIKTLHLQQLVSLPSHALEPAFHPNRSASSTESYGKTPRQQPEGLKMRYRPFGVSDDSDLDSTSEPKRRAPEFRTPALVEESSHGKKRKRPKSDVVDSNASSVVKPKKRKESPQATPGAIENPIDIDAFSDKRSTGAESPNKTPHHQVNVVQSNGGLPNGNETKEERRKRRDKKKLDHRESHPKPATALPHDLKQGAETLQPGEVVEGAPAFANAVEGTTSINGIPPEKESKEEKAKRKKEKRSRRDTEITNRGALSISAEDKSHREVANSQEEMMQEIEQAQRDASIPIPKSENGPLEEISRSAQESQNPATISSRFPKCKETKEEKAKRREEKRRRRTERERGSA